MRMHINKPELLPVIIIASLWHEDKLMPRDMQGIGIATDLDKFVNFDAKISNGK